ncbi:MAG: hypothetical protein ABI743_04285, partial [bacterium]
MRWPVIVVFFTGLWLFLNNGGGSDLAKAPPILFAAVWWGLALAWALRTQRHGLFVWDRLDPGIRGLAITLLICASLNTEAAANFSFGGQLALIPALGWMQWVGLILSGIMLATWLAEDPGSLPWVVLQILLILGALVAIQGLLDFFQSGGKDPLSSVFAWHNPAGGYFNLLIPVAVARALADRRPSVALLNAGLALILFTAWGATLSRGAWLTGVVGLVVVVILLARQRLLIGWRIDCCGMLAGLAGGWL